MSAFTLDLVPIWTVILGVGVFLYVLLDGFDLGVGILYGFVGDTPSRNLVMNTVAPVWDGNETWLILGGVGLMAAFPVAFAIIIPAVYFPVGLMLLALIFRGVAFEFRYRDSDRRGFWDHAFCYGSILATFTQGIVLGAFIQGFKTDGQAFTGSSFDCFTPFGMENMDQCPYLVGHGRWGYRMGDAQMFDSMLRDGLNDAFCDQHSGWVTEDLVQKLQISRETQDAWALRSQQRFSAAQAAGKFDAEIASMALQSRKGPVTFAKDEQNRPDTTAQALAHLKPAFRKDGTITAGNAPGLNSGGAAMIVASEDWATKHGVEPMGRLVAFGVGAVEPGLFGLGPVPAVRQALERANWKVSDLERVEINEAFAAIAIAVTRELGLPEEIVNVEGGAVAHGHPIGATGAVLTTRLLHSMRRDGVHRGLVTLCIGGGQGIALLLETNR